MRAKKFMLFFIIIVIICFTVVLVNGYYQNRVLLRAIKEHDTETAKNAIHRGAFLDIPQYLLCVPEITTLNPTPLIVACKTGDFEIVKLLIDYGADINKLDNTSGESPLMAALHGTKENRFSLALFLIEQGADIRVTQTANSPFQESLYVSDQDTPKTIEEGYQLFQLFMQNSVDMTVYVNRQNALTYSAQYRNYNAVKYLIERGYFEVNAIDDGGSTALITAAKHGNTDIVELLMKLGANKSLRDISGKTAYDYAQENQSIEIIALLSR